MEPIRITDATGNAPNNNIAAFLLIGEGSIKIHTAGIPEEQ